MKIVIFSDLHDNLEYLNKCISYCRHNKIDSVLCCGDSTSNETIKKFLDFKCPVYVIRGNADIFDEDLPDTLTDIHYLGRTGEVTLADKKIGLCHEPFYLKDLLPNNYYIIFYGHTHKPWVEIKSETHLINPGTLGGFSYLSTFAMWDTDKPLPELVQTNKI